MDFQIDQTLWSGCHFGASASIDLEDKCSDPLMVVRPDWRILVSNESARDFLRTSKLITEHAGVLKPTHRDISERLRHAMAASSAVGRPHILRLGSQASGTHLTVESSESGMGPCFCLLIKSLETRIRRIVDRACVSFKLTPAECLLAQALVQGVSAKAFSEQRGIKITTVRTQLASLYAKTGVMGHTQLVVALCLALPI